MKSYSKHQSGSSIIEFILGGGLLCLILLGAIQMLLLYQAHIRLQQATFEAARYAIVNNGTLDAIKEGFARSSIDLYVQGTSASDLATAYVKAKAAIALPIILGGAGVEITRLNPSSETFNDWGIQDGDHIIIKHAWARAKFSTPGATSGLTFQDAQILKIKVKYGYPLHVPVIGTLLGKTLALLNPSNIQYYLSNPARLPLTYTAVMHTQSDLQQ